MMKLSVEYYSGERPMNALSILAWSEGISGWSYARSVVRPGAHPLEGSSWRRKCLHPSTRNIDAGRRGVVSFRQQEAKR